MTKKKNVKSEVNEDQSIKPSKGRKTKGGKLISKNSMKLLTDLPVGNVILHLKCSFSDLEKYNENYNKHLTDPLLYIPEVPPEIQTYNTIVSDLHYNYIKNNINQSPEITEETFDKNSYSKSSLYTEPLFNKCDYAYLNNVKNQSFVCLFCKKQNDESSLVNDDHLNNNNILDTTNEIQNNPPENTEMSVINQKLKSLKIQLIKNKINDKKSACFWCTYDFDNPECYIPSYEVDNTICGYGSFCRPECAVAYLMKESIDDTTKFERYNLINQVYGKIYNYNKNIKPAPNPYYLLDKYYGNLTIKEYRNLLKSNHLLMLLEKPLTRVFPELHDENDDYSLYNYSNSSSLLAKEGNEIQYKVKKNNEKKSEKSKTSIINEHFGL
jgi:hypothetical protein